VSCFLGRLHRERIAESELLRLKIPGPFLSAAWPSAIQRCSQAGHQNASRGGTLEFNDAAVQWAQVSTGRDLLARV